MALERLSKTNTIFTGRRDGEVLETIVMRRAYLYLLNGVVAKHVENTKLVVVISFRGKRLRAQSVEVLSRGPQL